MIQIDGSVGEGGGQMLRTSVSLSAVTGEPVRISNIRFKRNNPGLAPSHMAALEAVAKISDAEVEGLYRGSKEIMFNPHELLGGNFEFDIGTAGSISLVLLSCIAPAALSKSTVTVNIKGGTDVNWSPPIDYLRMVHFPLLSKFGPFCDLELQSRGFYPEGGGEVTMEISPVPRLSEIAISSPGEVRSIDGIAYAQNLPTDVASRIKQSAIKALAGSREVRIETDVRRGQSTGAGIVLAAECDNTMLGANLLGARGVRSEVLGENCSLNLMETIRSGATVDEHMTDQILLYMALAEGSSTVLAEELTSHAETDIWVIEKFLGKRFVIDRQAKLVRISTT